VVTGLDLAAKFLCMEQFLKAYGMFFRKNA
jgi:hypothetical protein